MESAEEVGPRALRGPYVVVECHHDVGAVTVSGEDPNVTASRRARTNGGKEVLRRIGPAQMVRFARGRAEVEGARGTVLDDVGGHASGPDRLPPRGQERA